MGFRISSSVSDAVLEFNSGTRYLISSAIKCTYHAYASNHVVANESDKETHARSFITSMLAC